MRINSISNMSFGSIQIQKSKMDWQQRGASERLARTIEYTDKYNELTEQGSDIDIYILPKKNDLEIRLMDVYSGNFIKNKKGKMLNTVMNVWMNDGYEKATDRTLNLYEKVVEGKISRPDGDFISEDSDMYKINPRKAKKDISHIKKSTKELMEDLEISKDEAKEIVFDSYISTNNDVSFF